MNLIQQIYIIRKRMPEKTLLKLKDMLEVEIDRRLKSDELNTNKVRS